MQYVERRGHPRLRARHAPFPIDQAARERWLTLMERAFEAASLPPDAAAIIRAYFQNTATFLINRHE
jgi:hemoglobin